MTFVQRQIKLTLTLGQGTFADSGTNSLTLSGLRVSAAIEKYGAPSFNYGVFRIYGMTRQQMDDISTHWLPLPKYAGNTISVAAGSAGQMSTVFQGGIRTAWNNQSASPEGFFEITAYTAYQAAVDTLPQAQPNSYASSISASDALQKIATQAGFGFKNNGVTGVLAAGFYTWGSPRQQMMQVADAVNAQLYFDDSTTPVTVVAVPLNGNRGGDPVLVSKATGLIRYPTYTGSGIAFRKEFDPNIQFLGQVQVQSVIKAANGIWTVRKLTYELESQVPNGAWFTDVEGFVFGTT